MRFCRKETLLSYVGGMKYRVECSRCKFVGFQDEPLDSRTRPTNTPLFFTAIPEVQKPGQTPRVYYRTLFFWKCHVAANKWTKHNEGSYECVFCRRADAAGVLYRRVQLLEHIFATHVQRQPSAVLLQRFSCWMDERPVLLQDEHWKWKGRKFDILLPRPFPREEIQEGGAKPQVL